MIQLTIPNADLHMNLNSPREEKQNVVDFKTLSEEHS